MNSPFSAEAGAYQRGMDEQKQRDRAAAFGAIRQAARLARRYEIRADRQSDGTQNREASLNRDRAYMIRRAIRVAIGTDTV